MEELEPTPDTGVSVLGSLKKRREEIAKGTHLDLPVPRWDEPEVIVRFRPLEFTEIRKIQLGLEKGPKARRTQAEVNANIDILIRGCTAVVGRLDGQDYSLRPGDHKGEYTTFDEDLAANLELDDAATARDVVRALYITDGDIINTARKLIEWSGFKNDELDEDFSGE